MRELDPKIDLQKELNRQIWNVLQGNVIDSIRKNCEGSMYDLNYRSVMEGNSLRVQETLLPGLYKLCMEVKEKLGYTGNIDFYITSDNSVNAHAYNSDNEERPHIIDINSGMFNLMNEEELKYVVGHEIGHLINNDAAISSLFGFVYPNDEALEDCPSFLKKRVELYNQIAELSADRYGYMANENLDACVTAIFKMASGLNLEKMNVSIETLIMENNQRLNFFLRDNGVSGGSHPVNPIRIHALELFANAKTQVALTRGMNELVDVLQNFIYSDLDFSLAQFVTAAGIYVAQEDGKRDKLEEDFIISEIADFCLSPYKVLRQVEKGEYMKILEESTEAVLEMAPDMRINLLNYFIRIVIADNELDEKELQLIYDFGMRKLGYSEVEIAKQLGVFIHEEFSPRASALK
jgi:hypothetical protein